MNLGAFLFKSLIDLGTFGRVLGIESDEEMPNGIETGRVHYEDTLPEDTYEYVDNG
jgi:hypothetical protein